MFPSFTAGDREKYSNIRYTEWSQLADLWLPSVPHSFGVET